MKPFRRIDLSAQYPKRFSISVIGDIRIEFRTQLAECAFGQLDFNNLEFASIEQTIAGTAINFARHATRHFDKVHIVSRIGEDDFTPGIIGVIDDIGASATLAKAADEPNGITVLITDREHRRVIVSGTPTPIAGLTAVDVNAARDRITRSDILLTDGYLLINPVSRAAVTAAISVARLSATPVCLDLVPHDVDKYLTLDDLIPIFRDADIVISSARTLADLVETPSPYPYKTDNLHELASRLDVLTPSTIWLLRYGDRDIEQVGICHNGQIITSYHTGHRKGQPSSGMGDRVSPRELYELLVSQ